MKNKKQDTNFKDSKVQEIKTELECTSAEAEMIFLLRDISYKLYQLNQAVYEKDRGAQ